jgi:UDP-N-acetylmuramyl pentapeptide phosphotransferase/UDP-N-acetylglucosamine-1-phosphate transferase
VSPSVRRAVAGAVTAHVVRYAVMRRQPRGAQRWRRNNFRGRRVSLAAGPAVAVAAAIAGPGLPAVVAGLGAGLAGAYDDANGETDAAKGFRGHLTALRTGRVTAGVVKLAGISAAALIAAVCLRPKRVTDVLLGAGVVAGSANVLNLLDLRPGRALKVGVASGVVLWQPGVVGACLALLPADLRERDMLGDAGANALGAVLGVAVITRMRSRLLRCGVLAGVIALTAASERVSITAVIERSPRLRRIDQLGRLP